MSSFTESIRQQWRTWRVTARVKQGDAATKIGVHRNTLCQWELGNARLPEPAFNRVITLLAEHGITPQEEAPKIDIVWVECPECAQSVPALIGTRKFHHCAACGEALGKLCDAPACRHLNRFTARFCESCGSPLETHNTNYQLIKHRPTMAAENNGKPVPQEPDP